jgi:hypothetical protein
MRTVPEPGAMKAIPTTRELWNRSRRGMFSSLSASINGTNDLILEGHDIGSGLEEFFGRDEHEYLVTVPAAEKGHLLVELVHDQFSHVTPLQEWLTKEKLPFVPFDLTKGAHESDAADVVGLRVLITPLSSLVASETHGDAMEGLSVHSTITDGVLLALLARVFGRAKRFEGDVAFREWCASIGIATGFSSY